MFGVWLFGASLCALALLLAPEVRAADKWYVEFVGAALDEAQIRRAIALELREVEIPGDPMRAGDDSRDVALRILVEAESDAIEVSLWDRGEFTGRRKVSTSARTSVLSRRIGLAVGELGRQLAGHRGRVAARLEREHVAERQRQERLAELRRRRDLGLMSQVRSVIVPQGAWLVGPALGLELNGHFPLRFSPSVAWLSGKLSAFSDATFDGRAPNWSAVEIGGRFDYVWRQHSRRRIVVGGELFGATLHAGGDAHVDEILGQRDTWSARGGLRLAIEQLIATDSRLQLGVSAGSVLRRIPLRYDRTTVALGGGYVGVDFTVVLAPPAPPLE